MDSNSDDLINQTEPANEKEICEDLDDFIFSENTQKSVSER